MKKSLLVNNKDAPEVIFIDYLGKSDRDCFYTTEDEFSIKYIREDLCENKAKEDFYDKISKNAEDFFDKTR